MTPRTEQQLLDAVIDLATLSGWMCHHDLPARRLDGRVVTSIQGHAGFPDLVLCRRGVLLLREVKGFDSRGRLGVLSTEQREWRGQILGPGFTFDRVFSAGIRCALLFDTWSPPDWDLVIVPTLTAKIGARA